MPGDGPARLCVAGLGNPGGRYERTRHNVGFLVVDELAARNDTDIRRQEFLSLTARALLGRTMVLLMKPQTFMNASGPAVAAALDDLGLSPGELVVVYDDLDLPLGRIRVRPGGGAGGHRGVTSLIETLGTGDFARVRVGIGRPAPGQAVVDHVLSPFADDEAACVREAVALAADAVACLAADGVVRAMEAFNGR